MPLTPFTPEAATDLLLALVCAGLAVMRWRQTPGTAIALGLLGLAAALGVAHFSAMPWAAGPHRFAVLVANNAAVPLLAWCLRWPDSLPAQQPRAACIAIVFGGATGIGLVGLLGIKIWALLCLVLAAALLLAAAWERPRWSLRAGVALLLAAGVVQSAAIAPAGLSTATILHLLLALGLASAVGGDARPRH